MGCLLYGVDPASAGVPPQEEVLDSTNVPLVFPPESKVFTTVVRVFRDLLHALILLGTTFLRTDHRVIILSPKMGSNRIQRQHRSRSFFERHRCLRVTPLARWCFVFLPHK